MKSGKSESEHVVRPDAIAALGDPDDHLRLAVLLGHEARARGHDSEVAAGCIEAHRWREKSEHLARLVHSPALDGLIFHDLDALWQSDVRGPDAWTDSAFRRERTALFDLLLGAAEEHHWRLVRPVPRAPVPITLSRPPSLAPDDPPALDAIAPEIRPLARSLIERSIVNEFGLEDIVEAADELQMDASKSLIARADERLTGLARDAALRLSLLRIHQPWNGVVGPYRLAHGTDEHVDIRAIDRAAAHELVELGLLHVDGGHARMPRLVRAFYERRAWATGDINPQTEHQWLARREPTRSAGASSAVEHIERHHHAIEGEDFDMAVETGTYYLNDLRQLATRIGRRPGRGNKNRAARIFERIVQRDPEDAYAWEYYGFNLAQVEPESEMIQRAYERACDLEPSNPLYRGRLLGWRARRGADIVDEARHRIVSDYLPDSVAATWFAYQVIRGLQQGRQHQQLQRFEAAMGTDRIAAWLNKRPADG